MALIDLPEVTLVDTDVSTTLNNMVTVYEGLTGTRLYPGDPVRLFLNSIALLIVQQRMLINDTGRINLLRYARAAVLDHIGAVTETPRLGATAAVTTVRFTLSAAQPSAINIPIGTRVATATDPKRYYQTTAAAEVPIGLLTVDVPVTCTEVGEIGNGYLPGQISEIVDPIPFVLSAVNLTETAGGADVEADEAYRERIHKAPESFSVAGPSGAYEYWAKTASASIIDVAVNSPAPCEVSVVPLLAGGEIPGPEILEAVEVILSDKRIRPLTDLVTVSAPTAVSYDITLIYYIDRARSAEVTGIRAAVSQAIADYALWQKSRLGRDINPSEMIRRVMVAGAYRVDVVSPSFLAVADNEVAIAGDIDMTYGGLADD